MAETKLKDIIEPETFNEYLQEEVVEKNRLLTSGIASPDPNIGEKLSRGGRIIHLPFWKDSDAEDEVLDEEEGLTVQSIEAGEDIACIHARSIMWGSNDIAAIASGEDPMGVIAANVAKSWEKNQNRLLASTLDGVFKAESMKKNLLDITTLEGAAGIISAEALVDTMYLLGENYDELSGIIMHPFVMAKLVKLDLIEYTHDSEGKPVLPIYMGKSAFVDSTLKAAGGAYPIYMFGANSIAFNENTDLMDVETDRDIRYKRDYLTSSRVFTMHPRGVKWVGKSAKFTPSNTELSTGINWELVAKPENVHITKLVARIK